ncbi:hypothetical protein [Coprococcus comes]|uniref:hypothetical protein n=1 Tax=Coprococcus comes TaxID=410072 RepID=UPI001FAE6283|nr:hypothetical protein [Coprococcus comes]
MADKKTENRNIDTAKARGELEEDLLEYVYRKWRQGRQITSKEYARTTGITTSEVLFLYKKYPVNSSLSNQSSETLVFSRKIGILILVPYVFSLVFALMSRNKGNFLFRFPRPPYQAVLRKFVSLPS